MVMNSQMTEMPQYNRREPPKQELLTASSSAAVHLLTFAAGSDRLHAQVVRLASEARRTGWFASVTGLTDRCDHPYVRELAVQFGDFIRQNERGYGYWIWKPFLVSRMLNAIPAGDILVYMDAGCEISYLGAPRFAQYIAHASVSGTLFFQIPFLEGEWTKSAAFDEVDAERKHASSWQVQATWFALRNIQVNKNLCGRWLDLCSASNGRLLTDALDDRDAFLHAHRHDQSLLSLLVKQSGIGLLDWEDRFDRSLYTRDSWTLLLPVHASRCRSRGTIARLSSRSSAARCAANAAAPHWWFLMKVTVRRAIRRIQRRALLIRRRAAF